MAPASVNANIQEVDGAYYQVHLSWIPRVGELIDLFSFLDASSGHQAQHSFEVVQVVHKLHDVVEHSPSASSGHHFVTVLVKQLSEPAK